MGCRPAADRSAQPHTRVGSERGVGVAGSIDEQLDRIAVDAQRRHAHDPFAIDTESFAARRQDPQPRAPAQRLMGEVGDSVEQMFAVVKHHQQGAVADPVDDRRPHRQAGTGREPQRGRHERLHVGRIGGGGQLHQPHTARVGRADRRGRCQREAGLAHPGRTSERHKPLVDQLTHTSAISVARPMSGVS